MSGKFKKREIERKGSEKEYEKYLDSLGSRADLNYIFQHMLGVLESS